MYRLRDSTYNTEYQNQAQQPHTGLFTATEYYQVEVDAGGSPILQYTQCRSLALSTVFKPEY